AADVVGDRAQPGLRLANLLAALEGPEGVEECRLRDVLGVGRVAHHRQRVAVHVTDVLAIQRVGDALRARRACGGEPHRITVPVSTGDAARPAGRGAAGRTMLHVPLDWVTVTAWPDASDGRGWAGVR